MGLEQGSLGGGERFDRVAHAARSVVNRAAGPPGSAAAAAAATAISSTRWPPGPTAKARRAPQSSRVSSTSWPASATRASVASKSSTTTAAWPSTGAVAPSVWIRWIWVPSRSTQVT